MSWPLPRGFSVFSRLCPAAAGVVAKEIRAAANDQRALPRDLGGGRALVAGAKQDKLDAGTVVRIDSTITEALMHEPSDSALLWDAVRVMSRLLCQAAKLPGAPAVRWHDRRRLAKRCATEIQYCRGK